MSELLPAMFQVKLVLFAAVKEASKNAFIMQSYMIFLGKCLCAKFQASWSASSC